MAERRTVVVTGASAGIGAATARRLAEAGYAVIGGARRVDRVREALEPLGGRAIGLDVTDDDSVRGFVAEAGAVDVLINNAGLSLGLAPVADGDLDDWRTMYETNVLGVLRLTRALLPSVIASGDGHVVNVGSIAGFETYPGGAGYTASKHALRALTKTLRQELLGEPVRVTEICPGLVETEFSLVRFRGDRERAASVYRGLEALTGEDIAECILWALERPPHVNVDEIVVRPRDQATATQVHRRD
ncbi:MAG: SDR family NAD(P)-dependent oxidoreductase [Thermoanaerobaculia bacterium]